MIAKPTIFREYDIRGVADEDFDQNLVYRLGRAYMQFAEQRLGRRNLKIAIGRDCRLTGEKYANALAAGLSSAGAQVTSLGMISTPISYFAVYSSGFDGAIMVTGSHNPPEYNGFKICLGKGTLFGQDIQELQKLIRADAAPIRIEPNTPVAKRDLLPEYLDYIVKNVKVRPGIRIAVDAGNGAAGPIAPELYRRLGCEVTELFCQPDGRFPNHEADPTVPANLQDLIAAVREKRMDFGIAFDGDADRIGVVDESGRIVWGDELLVIFSRAILKSNPGATIISEVKSSNRLYNDIEQHGGKPIMWKTGHSLIKAKIKETHAALAGEMSGHIFFADRFFGFDDAIYAGARLLEIYSQVKGPMSSLLEGLPPSVATPEIRVTCADEKKWGVVERLKGQLKDRYKVIDIDGVRADFGDGWGLVRASNTQPVIVMRFESTSQTRLGEIRSLMESEARLAGLEI